jgi:hypothetical protein
MGSSINGSSGTQQLADHFQVPMLGCPVKGRVPVLQQQ